MSDEELNLVLKILPEYELYLGENMNSLLARIYGAYTVDT